ncbi:MAG: HU family DNA-binding protein [Bacteroides sp.]|nr:HU family DNA-binding protein [Bacteroides sp.]
MGILYDKKEFVLSFKDDKPTMYRIAPIKQPQVPFEKLLDEVSSSCGVGRAQVKASVETLLDRMTLFMEYGMSVRLGDFGSFKPTIHVKSQTSVEDLGADNVKRKKILFRPGKRFKNMLDGLTVTALDGSIRKSPDNDEDDSLEILSGGDRGILD